MMIMMMKPAPFIKTWRSTGMMMLGITFSLYLLIFPYLLISHNFFRVASYAVLTAIVLGFELLMNLVTRRLAILDGSALVTATLLFLLLPENVSLSTMLQISFFAIVVGKWAMGGVGFTYVNSVMLALLYFLLTTSHSMEESLLQEIILWLGSPIFLGILGILIMTLALVDIIDKVVLVSFILGYLIFSYVPFYFLEGFDSIWQYWTQSLFWVFVAGFIATNYANLPSRWLGKLMYGLLMSIFMLLFSSYNDFKGLAIPLAVLMTNVVSPIINYYTLGKTFAGNKKKRW